MVVGAGVIGLAVSRALALRGLEVVVVEAAGAVGTQTSSRNSEVIHAGIYYPAGSLKARLCVAGRDSLYRYCELRGIRHRRIGKLIVAATDAELPVLDQYWQQAGTNGVDDLRWMEGPEAARLEPQIRCARALWSPSTGIIDSHEFMLALQSDLEANNGQVALNSRVTRIEQHHSGFAISIDDTSGLAIYARHLINAAGLAAQEVAALVEAVAPATIPARHLAKGHYYTLSGRSPFSHLVYPIAEAGGLGIHVTLDQAGAARFGPDVQWLTDINYAFDASTRSSFIAAIRRYFPDLDESRLQPGYTGIRPKLSGPGEPAADFVIQREDGHGVPRLTNLYGIESPGLTAALAIADEVAARVDG
ncbi:MAG: NAD(P)/FAD-dependent oxidoreductase [Gammaproteobacteria bacterium]